jgi:hypothetical protein
MQKISIEQTLSILRSDNPCSITLVRSTGATGSLKHISHCSSGIRYNIEPHSPSLPSGLGQRKENKHTLQGTIPLIDLDKNQGLTILISHIIYCNGYKVIH